MGVTGKYLKQDILGNMGQIEDVHIGRR